MRDRVYYDCYEMRCLADYTLDNKIEAFMWKTNYHEDDIKLMFKDNFWCEVMLAWSQCSYHNPKKKHHAD